jgi:hypothetical protein
VDRTYDTKIFLSLNQIWLEDHYQTWGGHFSFLANSCSDADDKSDLIKTCYTVLNKVLLHPHLINYGLLILLHRIHRTTLV